MGFDTSYLLNKKLTVEQSYLNGNFGFTPISGADEVIFFNIDNGLFLRSGTKVLKSTDKGITKIEVLDVGVGSIPFSMFINASGIGFLFTQKTNGDASMYKTTDRGATWTLIDTSATGLNLDPFAPPYPTGIANFNSNWIINEYRGGSYSGNLRLIGSFDGGNTWYVIISLAVPSEIRHWHNVQYINRIERFVATTGDNNGQIRWYMSPSSNGTGTWINITVPQLQSMRTVKFVDVGGRLFWVSDGIGSNSGIYSTKFDNTTTVITEADVTLHLPQNQPGLGIANMGNFIFASFGHEAYVYGDWNSYLYCSRDYGETWDIIKREPKTKGVYKMGGFSLLWGPDKDGEIYLNCVDSKDGVKIYRVEHSY